MTPRHRARQVVNLVNGSTAAGVGVALAGRARLARGPEGLLTATGYRPPVPFAPAFTLGNVIVSRRGPLPPAVFAHEARHATQYAWCGGLLMLPLYFAAAAVSWLLSGDFGAWNAFERRAGLADGGYAARPPRPALRAAGAALRPALLTLSPARAARFTGSRRPAGARDRSGGQRAAREPAGPGGSTSTPSR